MRLGQRSVVIVDSLGCTVVCALVVAGVWLVFLRPSAASAMLGDLRETLAEKTRDLATLERELGKQATLMEQRREGLEAAGAPLGHTRIEDDLRTITGLARQNDVHLAEVTPTGSTSYPGVREVRYHIRASGRYRDLARMLWDFEACDFWGDVTYLQIGSAKGPADARTEMREMNLTVSFYSAAPAGETSGTQ